MKKILYSIIALALLGLIGFQFYFYSQVRKTFEAVVADQILVRKFLVQEFPSQVKDYNSKVPNQK